MEYHEEKEGLYALTRTTNKGPDFRNTLQESYAQVKQ